MSFCDLEGRQAKDIFPGVTTQTFWGDKMLLSRVTFAPNAQAPSHQHPHEQSGVILSGELYFTLDGETRLLKSGDMYIAPGNVVHAARGGEQGCVTLEIFSPVRETLQY